MLLTLLILSLAQSAPVLTPEAKAVAFLSREVPSWNRDNHCFSCHNNGDGARALFAASHAGISVAPEVTRSTLEWLASPDQWEKSPGSPAASDKRLALVQFTYALRDALRAGAMPVSSRATLLTAAANLARIQDADGAWADKSGETLGSPATYGTTLATALSRDALREAGEERFADAIRRADKWLAQVKPDSTLDHAALLLAGARTDTAALLKAQTRDGGFGPYAGTPPEVFDTAIAMLALKQTGKHADAIARARGFLIASQNEDGSWPETTRPSGSQSYAQRMSTTGWATLALIASAK